MQTVFKQAAFTFTQFQTFSHGTEKLHENMVNKNTVSKKTKTVN